MKKPAKRSETRRPVGATPASPAIGDRRSRPSRARQASPLQQRPTLDQVFHALSDPVRLGIVLKLSRQGECSCAALDDGRAKSTMSHHFKVLRAAGLVHTDIAGVTHVNRLCRETIDTAYPGLLDAVLAAASK